MIVYIIRHAWAGHFGDPNYPDDNLRPLSDAGKVRFQKFVKKLVKRGFQPELIASSPLVRCRQTAEIVAEMTPGKPAIEVCEALAPGSHLGAMAEWTRGQDGGDVAWVGHAPDVGQMTSALIGGEAADIHFSKGAVAAIEFDEQCHFGHGQLRLLLTADQLGC